MSVVDDKSVFMAMKQDGPFAVEDRLAFGVAGARLWAERFRHNPQLVSKYRATRGQIFDLLAIDRYQDIPALIADLSLRQARQERAYRLLGNLFAIGGDLAQVRSKIHEYAGTADLVIAYLKQRVLAAQSSHIELSNEIETAQGPVDLLLLAFDHRYHKKVRFEAKRKLVLMGLAGSIDQRERETGIESKFAAFLDFLNRQVWSPKLKIGELEVAYLHSRHHPEDFRCLAVQVISSAQAVALGDLGEGEKLTLIKRRLIEVAGREIPVYVTVRKKDSAAKVLKLLRKNEKNPALAVDDELGLMAVLDSRADIRRFVRHMTRSALAMESIMILEDISDTISGGAYGADNVGSSAQTPMLKFFARLGGMRVEFIIHTNQSYLDYRYRRGVSHDEYEVRRLFDSGVADFLFPNDIYHLDMERVRQRQLRRFRHRIEAWE